MGVEVDPAAARVRVHWPWAHLLAGQAQYELLLGVIWCAIADVVSFGVERIM